MFRKMRRNRQQLPEGEVIGILERNDYGVLSVLGDDGYPYGVPVNYVYHDGKILFHAAVAGHKKDSMERCDKVCFTVVDTHEVLPAERATRYRSVIAFGRARFVEEAEEKKTLLRLFGYRHSGAYKDDVDAEITEEFGRTLAVEITIEYAAGKESKDLMMQREKTA